MTNGHGVADESAGTSPTHLVPYSCLAAKYLSIDLRYDSAAVFVEISRDICGYRDAVLATLCHEVCHQFLHVRGIRHGAEQIEEAGI